MEIANEHRLTEVEARSKSNTKRLDELEHKLTEYEKQNTTVAVLEVRMKAIELKIDTLCAQVESIKAKPAKRWESLVGQAMANAFMSAALTVRMKSMGMITPIFCIILTAAWFIRMMLYSRSHMMRAVLQFKEAKK